MNLFSYIIVAFTQKIQSQFLSHLKLANSLLFPYAPHISSVVSLYGALSPFRTVHIFRSFPGRCTFTFSHRTHLPQPSCTVLIHLSAPHTSSVAFLCGALSHSRTVHIFRNLPVRCSFTFPLWPSSAFPRGARFHLIILIPFTEQRGRVGI